MSRISALVMRDYRIFMSTHWRLVEFLYFPITTVLIWGFFALWTSEFASAAGMVALAVNIFWTWAYTVQSTVNMAMNEDVWSGSGPELFATGLSKWEYMTARIILSAALSIVNIIVIAIISKVFGFFDFLAFLGPTLVLLGIVFVTAIALALMIAGIFYIAGVEHSWIAWSVMQFFVLLSSPLAPPSVLPSAFATIASVMPFTALFEAVRAVVTAQPWTGFAEVAFVLGMVYMVIGIVVYHYGFEHARKTGELAKMI